MRPVKHGSRSTSSLTASGSLCSTTFMREEEPGQTATMARIIRAYKQKIRRQLGAGSRFDFWKEISVKDYAAFVEYVRSHLGNGMTWLNYGEWQLRNVSSGKATQVVNQKTLRKYFNHKNFIPAWRDPVKRLGARLIFKHG